MPPLGWAALGNQPETIREILAKCPTAADWVQETNTNILEMTIGVSAEDAAIELARSGIGLDAVDENGATPLDHASMLQQWRIVEELLRHEDDLNARNQYGRVVGASVLFAYQYGPELPRRALVDAVARGFILDQPIKTGQEMTVRDFLIDRDPGIFEAYPALATPLHIHKN
ncbi:MAG: hypothetical protein KDA31_07675 [Phycisphaerales bacterium]|nr:hypothetical protein [Phycisphaerales bacterium]MCB9836095.1 ankyrin repeat domain-containing protein [Phycisphaera sp.]